MTTKQKIKRLEKNGHTVAMSMSTGQIIVKSAWGATNTFKSYSAAYNWHFKAK